MGSKYSFQSYKFTFNKYWSLAKRQVLAYNGFVCFTGGQPPFYGNCIYGTNSELRGYTAGRYLDRVVRSKAGWKFARKTVILDSRRIDTLLAIPL